MRARAEPPLASMAHRWGTDPRPARCSRGPSSRAGGCAYLQGLTLSRASEPSVLFMIFLQGLQLQDRFFAFEAGRTPTQQVVMQPRVSNSSSPEHAYNILQYLSSFSDCGSSVNSALLLLHASESRGPKIGTACSRGTDSTSAGTRSPAAPFTRR